MPTFTSVKLKLTEPEIYPAPRTRETIYKGLEGQRKGTNRLIQCCHLPGLELNLRQCQHLNMKWSASDLAGIFPHCYRPSESRRRGLAEQLERVISCRPGTSERSIVMNLTKLYASTPLSSGQFRLFRCLGLGFTAFHILFVV